MESYAVPGLKEAAVLAMNDYNWRPVRSLLESTIAKGSVQYTQLQQIDANDNIIKEACSRGFTELVSVFLNSGVQANCVVEMSTGRRMLHLAAKKCHLSLVKLLINSGAEIDCKAHDGKTPLFCAVEIFNFEVVKHLISAGSDIHTCDKDGNTLLDVTCIADEDEMLQLLLDSGCDPNKCHSCCLYLAVWCNKLNHVRMLLEAGANVNGMDTCIPLHVAARDGNIPVMQLLLDYGAEVNAKNENGDTALHKAVIVGNLQSVEFLIEHGSLINSVNNNNQMPLELSFNGGHTYIAMLLINGGADITLEIHHTLLHDALDKLAPICVIESLLEHGADPTTVYNNKTALRRAISYGLTKDWKLDRAKFLLIYGSNHYEEDDHGNTLLHWACEMGDVELVKYLIHYGLDVDAKNREGKKPYDIAKENGCTNIVKAIIHYHCNKYCKF